MQGSTARRASIILGVFMAIVLIAGAILPLVQNASTTTTTTQPTDAPIPTFPPPPSNLETILFDQLYLHPTGLFAIPQPTGFTVSQPNSQPTIAQVNMINQDFFSVIDAYIEDPLAPITADQLDARFNQSTLAASWQLFNTWDELARRMDGDSLLIDFQVNFQNQTYIARQRVWTDGEWIYVVRVLAPENARDYLLYLLDNLTGTMQPFKMFAGEPFDWQAYYDHLLDHIIRYPSGWTVTDSAAGRPASITGTNGESLRVEAIANTTVEDEDAASAWVESQRSGSTVLSVAPVNRGDVSGFSVAYAFTTADGAPQSGLAVLLNGTDGTLHVANLRFPADNIDLNSITSVAISDDEVVPESTPVSEATEEAAVAPEGTQEATVEPTPDPMVLYYDLALSMSTFRLMPPLNLSADSLPPTTPTPLPTAAVSTEEATLEATAEATGEAEATDEAAVEATEAEAETEEAATARPTRTPRATPTEAEVETEEAATERATPTEAEAETEEAATARPTRTPRATPTEAEAEPTREPTVSSIERFAATATALAESRLTPTATPRS